MPRRPQKKRWLPWVVVAALTALTILYVATLPNPSELARTTPDLTALMQLRMEEAKDAGKKYRVRKRWVPLRAISPLLRDAIRVSEDADFYTHDGFDFEEIQDAFTQGVREGHFRGASTISQQLVKNVYLSPSRNPVRKLSEAILTYRLEENVEKNRILELYLNLIEWGDGVFGIEEAARTWFNESAFTLSPAQAVLLAAMVPMPLKTDPRTPSRWLKRRAKRLLDALKGLGRISDAEYDEAARAL
ncbi:MAG: monofunctional biosynthetic peptidoglycan transglycosylase [Deltaproteobacteria bacterium]|nr:monofunctional biosynthetic peptidoglycan transglycosylase [Deltaproteobacteria bacterium]